MMRLTNCDAGQPMCLCLYVVYSSFFSPCTGVVSRRSSIVPFSAPPRSLELQRVFSASLARSMTTAAALNATALVQYEMGEL